MIEVEELRKTYGDLVAVDGVSFTAEPGTIFGLLGPNGAGKSTTIGCISGLLRPSGGRVKVLGHDVVVERKAARESVGASVVPLLKTSRPPRSPFRKMRCTPLRQDVAAVLKQWLSEQAPDPDGPLFPSSSGGFLSADALQRLVARHAKSALQVCPSLTTKTVTPHTLRHTVAMRLLWCGVDLTVIALWLGHESTETTQIYLHADMRLKERALAHAAAVGVTPDRYRPPDTLLSFLESL